MTMFVDSEYVIAHIFIALRLQERNIIPFYEIKEIGYELQDYCNNHDIDVVINTYGNNIMEAIYKFPQYFEYAETPSSERYPAVRLRRYTSIRQLEQRFSGYLKKDINEVLTTKMLDFIVKVERTEVV
jgi:hypothetical protein